MSFAFSEKVSALAPGLTDLSNGERAALADFAICWTVFESRLFDCSVNAARIKEKVEGWLGASEVSNDWFAAHLDYFKERYTKDGDIGDRFRHLHLRENDDPDLVRHVLVGEDQVVASQLTACLIVVYRYRNNFFHGHKWAYQFRDQQQNLEHATDLIIQCTSRYAN